MGVWIFKTCEQCGKEFLVVDAEVWAYKRKIRSPGDPKIRRHWYCTWTCMCKAQRKSDAYYDAIHAEQYERKKARQRANAAEKRKKEKAGDVMVIHRPPSPITKTKERKVCPAHSIAHRKGL